MIGITKNMWTTNWKITIFVARDVVKRVAIISCSKLFFLSTVFEASYGMATYLSHHIWTKFLFPHQLRSMKWFHKTRGKKNPQPNLVPRKRNQHGWRQREEIIPPKSERSCLLQYISVVAWFSALLNLIYNRVKSFYLEGEDLFFGGVGQKNGTTLIAHPHLLCRPPMNGSYQHWLHPVALTS